ncbi:MAG: class I SAM-dependent methyltransferase [Anaerolineales bacterium]
MNLLRRLMFEVWYWRNPPWDTGISPPELLEFLQTHPAGRALDIGCGTGTNLITFCKHGWQAAGVDFSYSAIFKARQKLHAAGCTAQAQVADAGKPLPVRGEFDLMLDMGCLHGLDATARGGYRANLQRHLAPQGTYLLYTHLKPTEDTPTPGLTETALQELQDQLRLIRRVDGTEHGTRPSAWLWFQH